MYLYKKIFNVVSLLSGILCLACEAKGSDNVLLNNGKTVSREVLGKVSGTIERLKKDPTFENQLIDSQGSYDIPPRILTEAIFVLGQKCKDGCEITKEEFGRIMHSDPYVVGTYIQGLTHLPLIDKQAKKLTDQRIDYIYTELSTAGVISSDLIKPEEGAVLNASVRHVRDAHISGVFSRGFVYIDPVKRTWLEDMKSFLSGLCFFIKK